MKNEYISREAAIDAVLSYKGYFQDQLSTNNMILKMEAEFAIDDVPAADVIEVVRCRDCKYSGMYCFGDSTEERLACLDIEDDGFIRCAKSVDPNDLCSRGERRENG